ncbi:MAG TPA: cytochrome c oxidase subunit II, partial [Acidimicrobiia bacterium]|nr:cytochrome c oxidase subunit II [Acidimicrobiia bacterium]
EHRDRDDGRCVSPQASTRALRDAGAVSLLLAIPACGGDDAPSALNPAGPEAERIAWLWWLMLALAGVVFVIVMGSLALGILRRRPDRTQGGDPVPDTAEGDRLSPGDRRFMVGGGVLLPGVILTALGFLTVGAVDAVVEEEGDLVVEVEGVQFWWDVVYPDFDIRTANAVHIPTGRDVTLRLGSDDVIHSFWVPELAGKRDLVPGRTNTLVLRADEPGRYRGQCAEYCGLQHANMAFEVVALPPEAFEAWVADWQDVPSPPDTAAARLGRRVFETSACAGCHTVRGTAADGTLGPDLTDLATRRWIGAGAAPNDLGHLAGWVLDAQSIKPGALMPPVELDPAELDALLAYLATLRP